MRRFSFLLLALISGAGVWLCEARPDAQAPINKAQRMANFCQLFTNAFVEWDANHDGKLNYQELSEAIANPKIHNSQSAVAMAFHEKMVLGNGGYEVTNSLNLDDVVKLAKNAQVQKNLLNRAWNTDSYEHALFSLNDPNLLTVQQGGLGDATLVAVIGTFIYHNPQALWVMIAPQSDGSYEIQFDSGKMIAVDPVTETEIMMGGNQGRRHGLWLTVLEKAYRQFSRETNSALALSKAIAATETINTQLNDRDGRCALAIALLSGNKAAEAPVARWIQDDPTNSPEKIHALLAELSQNQKMMCASTSQDVSSPLPEGILHNHTLGILKYDAQRRMVTLFNPRSNRLKPANPPGLTNGYATEHGVFEMPLADFAKICNSFIYETDAVVNLAERTTVHSCEMFASR